MEGEPGDGRKRPGKSVMLRAAVEVMGEDGYEGASIRDIAGRAGVSVAALYHHFPSKLDILGEFLDEAYDVILARLHRRLRSCRPTSPARLDEIVGTLIAGQLHDEWAQLAANVANREYTRLDPPDREAIEEKRHRLLELVEDVLRSGVAAGDFSVDEPREAARAIVTLSTSLVEGFAQSPRSMAQLIATYQRFARAIACTPSRVAQPPSRATG